MPTDLLAELDTTPYGHRGQLLATWGSDTDVDRARRALAASDEPWLRRLAVLLDARRQDAPALLAALRDPSRQVRRVACRHAIRHVRDPADLAAAITHADPATRRRLLQHVARAERHAVARLVAPRLLATGDHRAALVVVHQLPWGQVETIQAIVGPWAMPWKRLALAQPEAVVDHLQEQLAATSLRSEHDRLWGIFSGALHTLPLARLRPLLATHPPSRTQLLVPILGPLLRDDPELATRLFLEARDTTWTDALGHRRARHLRTLSDDRLQHLAVHLADEEHALTHFLAALSPSRRHTVYDAVLKASPDRMWSMTLLDVLPHEQRHAQAHRHLARLRDEPDGPASIAPWLPLDESTQILVPEGRPMQREGDERAQTWTRWLDTIAHERRGLDPLLQQVPYIRNEQDPVRYRVIDGLSRIPIRLVQPHHLPALRALTTAILEARDTSWSTRRSLQTFTLRLLVQHAPDPDDPRFAFALALLERSRAHGQALDLPRLDQRLKRGAERAVCDAILSHIRQAAERERGRDVVALARAFDERAWHLDELQQLLGEVARTDRESSVRAGAITHWIAAPATRDERVQTLLAHDESAAVLHPVWRHLAGWRTDRLDPYLEGRRLKGRWGSLKAGWIPHRTDLEHRWLPRQQRALIGLLSMLASDTGHSLSARAGALLRLASIPATRLDDLTPWFDRDVQLAEAAMGVTARLDHPAPALPVLLQHLDGDRARVAMYVVPAVARHLAADVLQDHLAALLEREHLKVTVHKEAIRLLGQHRLPRSDELLQAQWAKSQHRDVRIALLHAVTGFLDRPWAWELLEHAATEADPELPLVLAALTPWTVPGPHHTQMLDILGRLATHPDKKVRKALFDHLARDAMGLGRADPAQSVDLAARGVLDVPAVAAAAAEALVVLGSLHDLNPTQTAIEALRDAATTEPIVPSGDAPDRPHLRTLHQVLNTVSGRLQHAAERYRPLAHALAATLTNHADTYVPRMTMLLAAHPGDATPLPPMVAQAPHVHDLTLLDLAIAHAIGDRQRSFSLAQLLAWHDGLRSDVDAAPVRLSIVRNAAIRYGWGSELRDRLAELRRDPVVGRRANSILVH